MEISRKTDYALRMMACLTQNDPELVSVKQAAEENGVPYSFARSIQHDLVRAGLIESIRGSRGGMRLKVDPHDVTLLDIVEAIQGPVKIATCERSGPNGAMCGRVHGCPFHPIWNGANQLLIEYFGSVSLYDIVYRIKFPEVTEEYIKERAHVVAHYPVLEDEE